MTSDPSTAVRGKELQYLHRRLVAHFEDLKARRASAPTPAPIFALEHGLGEAELLLLRTHVCEAVRQGRLSRDAWLPFVVYATEVGYDYSGDEYWQTFEERTPGWATFGDRQYIRTNFIRFKNMFNGAEPSGAWARHFSIICWPITHAVLPDDLQRHLARLLFEYRRALTADLLHDPDELGQRLAARSWQASSRFQNFAQNTELLGRVAAALLVGEEEESPYLLTSTLHRVVADLEQESQARRWLRDARSTASQVRTRGFRPSGGPRGEVGASRRQEALAPSTDPEFWLRSEDDAWTAYVDFPDLSILGERFPAVRDELDRLRAHIAGSAASPVARGRLLYGRQRFRLEEWPPPDTPLIQLEGGSSETNRLLSDQCALTRPAPWLFRVRDTGMAPEVRGGFVRPGHQYVVLTRDALSASLTAWMTDAATTTAGVHAYAIKTPEVLTDEHLSALSAIGLSATTEVEIRPAGLVPPLWDGEGTAEWFLGEIPTLAISSTRQVAQAIFTIDSDPRLIPWQDDRGPMFVSLDDLSAGVHEIAVSLIGEGVDQPVSEGSFDVLIRSPAARPTGGSLREGLMILPTPVSPSLDELWDGRAVLEVVGPRGAEVLIEIVLLDRSRRQLVRERATTALPIDRAKWLALLDSRFRSSNTFQSLYDDAEAAEVAVEHPSLGRVSLRAERSFAPLRWSSGRDKEGRYVRLIDNTEGAPVRVEVYDFSSPDTPVVQRLGEASQIRSASGGLVVAHAADHTAAMLLPREVRSLSDIHVSPKLAQRSNALSDLLALLALAGTWASASLTANPIGEWARDKVLLAITAEICGLVGGGRWASIERRLLEPSVEPEVSRLVAAIGDAPYQAQLAHTLVRRIAEWAAETPEARGSEFGTCLARKVPWLLRSAEMDNRRMGEFLLRLASQPASLLRWPPDEVRAKLRLILDSPVLLRAARLVVLAVEVEGLGEGAPTVGRWAWQ